MINLLPPFARKHVFTAYWIRVVALALFAWALGLFMVVIMHVTVFLELTTTIGNMQRSVGMAEELQAFTTNATTEISVANDKARLLIVEDSYEPFTVYTSAMEDLAGEAITIIEMQVRRTEESLTPLTVTAVAATRQDLISFLDAVRAHDMFGEVDIPIANLSQSQNINFSVQVPIIGSSE